MITKSSGNVFADLELPNPENLQQRALLMAEVRGYVKAVGLTQTEAAKQLGISQPRLNDILRGRIEKCTIDRLINMLVKVGCTVEITVKQAA